MEDVPRKPCLTQSTLWPCDGFHTLKCKDPAIKELEEVQARLQKLQELKRSRSSFSTASC